MSTECPATVFSIVKQLILNEFSIISWSTLSVRFVISSIWPRHNMRSFVADLCYKFYVWREVWRSSLLNFVKNWENKEIFSYMVQNYKQYPGGKLSFPSGCALSFIPSCLWALPLISTCSTWHINSRIYWISLIHHQFLIPQSYLTLQCLLELMRM